MKYLIASDIHGSEDYVKEIIKKFYNEKADYLVLLGDIYNHGPRNPLPEGYNPMAVAEALNAVKNRLIVIKGNCDSQVDTLISQFDFIESTCIVSGDKTVFLTHGHIYDKDNLPKTEFDCVIYGHYHVGFIEKLGKTTVANPGSVSLPKDGFRGYLILENGKLSLKDLKGKTIKEENI